MVVQPGFHPVGVRPPGARARAVHGARGCLPPGSLRELRARDPPRLAAPALGSARGHLAPRPGPQAQVWRAGPHSSRARGVARTGHRVPLPGSGGDCGLGRQRLQEAAAAGVRLCAGCGARGCVREVLLRAGKVTEGRPSPAQRRR